MKVIIEGKAYFPGGAGDDEREVGIQIVGSPDEDLEKWAVLLVHPKFSLEVSHEELRRALRVFETRREQG